MSSNDATAFPWDLPDPFFFEMVVQEDAIDEYDHTNNAVYLQWLDRVAWEHARAVGAGYCTTEQTTPLYID